MLKRIMLTLGIFAALALAYTIYQWQEAPLSTTERPADGIDWDDPLNSLSEDPFPNPQGPSIDIQGTNVYTGKRTVHRMYDDQHRLRLVFQASEWTPVSDTEWDLVEPSFRLMLPGGQVASVRADAGHVVMQKSDEQGYDFKRGVLQGQVAVTVDLTDYEWREAHPDQALPEQHPAQLIQIWMDHMRFDLELSLFDTDGPLLLQSTRADFEGKGFRLVWNEMERQIKQLVVHEGKRAVLRDLSLAGAAQTTQPATETQPADHAAIATVTETDASQSQADKETDDAVEQAEEDNVRVLLGPRGQRKWVFELPDEDQEDQSDDLYRIVFHDNVNAQQIEDAQVVGGLESDTLMLWLDFGGTGERAFTDTGTPTSTRPATQKAGQDKPVQPMNVNSMVELEWTGQLEILPIDREEIGVPEETEDWIHMRALGSPVRMFSRETGAAVCPELEYHQETKRIWLRGRDDYPVVLASGQQDRVIAWDTFFIDQQAGTARIDGPGELISESDAIIDEQRMAASASDESTDSEAVSEDLHITWSTSVDLELSQEQEQEQGQPSASATLSPIPEGTYLKNAVFVGDVQVTSADLDMSAGRVSAVFRKPSDAEQEMADQPALLVDRVIAMDDVELVFVEDESRQTISCDDQLEIFMTVDSTGRPVPAEAIASGQVRVHKYVDRMSLAQEPVTLLARNVRADEALRIKFASIPDPPTEQERRLIETRARIAAREQGIEEGSPAWEARQQALIEKLESRRRITVTEIEATGGVDVMDREQSLQLSGQDLFCSLGQDEQIEQARLTGPAGQPASIELEDFAMSGPRLEVDLPAERVDVPGEGSLRFLTNQDLDGREVSEPQWMTVSWSDEMHLRLKDNLGRFVGQVQAGTEHEALSADKLEMEFANEVPPTTAPGETAENEAADDLWVFGELFDRWTREDEPPNRGQLAGTLGKDLVFIRATGQARILASSYAPRTSRTLFDVTGMIEDVYDTMADYAPAFVQQKETTAELPLVSRVSIAGPSIGIDLRERQFLVEGKGHLQVEDYALPDARSREDGASSGATPSLAGLQPLRPSQTLFTWDTSMSYLSRSQTAVFVENVAMTHLAGSEMNALAGVADAMQVEPEWLNALPGREASLECDRFIAEFEASQDKPSDMQASLSSSMRLKQFWAAGQPVRLEEGPRYIVGSQMSFNSQTQVGQLEGGEDQPAQLVIKSPELHVIKVDHFIWNQATGILEAYEPDVEGTGG